jgi:hypothetical protein
MRTKFCSKCKRAHPITEFGRNRQARDGLHYHCKKAAAKRQRLWAAANVAKMKAMRETYRRRMRERNATIDPYAEVRA